MLHPTLSHQPCLPTSLTPPSPVDQDVKAGRGCPSPLLGWASFHSPPPLSPPQNRKRASSKGYLCIPAPSLAGVKEEAGGQLRSRERQELQGEASRGTHIAYCTAAPSPLARVACLCTRLGASAGTALLGQRQQVPGELERPSGRRKGHTLLLEALALHSSPLSMTKAWSPLALSAWPSTHPSNLRTPAFAPPLGQALQLKH